MIVSKTQNVNLTLFVSKPFPSTVGEGIIFVKNFLHCAYAILGSTMIDKNKAIIKKKELSHVLCNILLFSYEVLLN